MDFEAAIAYLITEIEKKIHGRPTVPEGFLDDFVENKSSLSSLLDGDLQKRLVRHLEEYFWTDNSNGHSLSFDFTSWYPERKLDDDFKSYYWRRLNKYWHDYNLMPKESVRATDDVTDEIMNYLGDPQDKGDWDRRGLVMGHVQSGKTTNYSALITKAADAGYTIIIVLAGMTKALRKQTQERLDMTFAGKSSLGDEVNIIEYPVARVLRGEEGYKFKSPVQITTQLQDFNVSKLRGSAYQEGNFADPVLFVTKKNVVVLETLIQCLSNLRPGSQLDGPMLVIDDEADNATVNTKKDTETSVTRTNERIRQLLQCARRTSYVGYTATPFANIFIHPESKNEMLGDDLFPKHFIKSLDPPSNYVGAKDLFSADGKYRKVCIREIEDNYQDLLPISHRSTHQVEELPPSLVDAVYGYFIFRALRLLDGETDKHSSMMINVSRYNAVQSQIYELVEEIKTQAEEHANTWSKSTRWPVSKVLTRMQEVWKREYRAYRPYSWDDVRKMLLQAIIPIELALVNMKGTALDYSSRKEPLHVIAIGGLALARGLTLEGLAVSYVLRNVGAGDTLLQLGRWFGYRLGYETLCRTHLTEDMISHFENISESIEELRDDLVRMERLKKNPEEFGLKVRESPTGIAITAANKMRTAKPIRMAADYKEKHIQGYEFYDEAKVNKNHLTLVADFHAQLMASYSDDYQEEGGALIWKNVNAAEIAELVSRFDLPQTEFIKMSGGESLLSNYILDRAGYSSDERWTVAMPYASSAEGLYGRRIEFPLKTLAGSSVFCRQRCKGTLSSAGNLKATEKNVVADLPRTDLVWGEDGNEIDVKTQLLKEQNPNEDIKHARAILNCREQPVLLVHLFQYALKDKTLTALPTEHPVATISLGFTETKFKPKERLYAATVRLIKQLNNISPDEDDDMAIDDD